MTTLFDRQKKVFLYALGLIGTESKWTQGANARNDLDGRVAITDPDACKFCSYGALSRSMYEHAFNPDPLNMFLLMDAFVIENGHPSIEMFNDRCDYAAVIDGWLSLGKKMKFISEDFTIDQIGQLVKSVV